MIYLDYNATTPLCDEARDAMFPRKTLSWRDAQRPQHSKR